MSLYRDYRPQRFNDLIGQDYIRQILQEALKAQRLAHAYLFSGTRGTGKTTTARLLAKAANCQTLAATPEIKGLAQVEPCNNCELCLAISQGSCLDVIEIDAASNRGIDEIRQLQEQLKFKPQTASKKIFIIDEAHMLTKEAFNALLKTLEEPPAYLLFVLATTEPHKLPATVISRCQRFDFITPGQDVIQEYLKRIATSEKIEISNEALKTIAHLAKGSFRDSATILEQLAVQGSDITPELIQQMLGLPENALIDRYIAVLNGDSDDTLVADIQQYFSRGGNASAFIDTAFSRLEVLISGGVSDVRAADILSRLITVKLQLKQSPIPILPIIVSLTYSPHPVQRVTRTDTIPEIRVSHTVATSQAAKKTGEISDSKQKTTDTAKREDTKPIDNHINNQKPAKSIVAPDAPSSQPEVVTVTEAAQSEDLVTIVVAEQVPPAILDDSELTAHWQKVLDRLLANNQSSLLSILRTAKPLAWEAPALKIGVQFQFHADQIMKQKNRDILESHFKEVLGSPVRLEPTVTPVDDLAVVAEGMF